MKKSANKLVALFVVLVFAFTLAAVPVAAYEASPEDILYVDINNSELGVRCLVLSNESFSFFGLSDPKRFNGLYLELWNSSGESVYQEYGDSQADGNSIFPMKQFPDGNYILDYWAYSVSVDGQWQWELLTSIVVARIEQRWQPYHNRAYAQNQALAQEESVTATALAWYLKPSDFVQSDDPRIIALALEITEGCESNYDKALAIHDWICEWVYYNYDFLNGLRPDIDVSALGVLDAGMTICAGYANLAAALLRAAGVPAKTVSGYAKDLSLSVTYPDGVFTDERVGNHAWNEFFSDGRWIVLDATWDCGNSFENGEKTKSLGCEHHKYFDPDADWLSLTHALVNVSDVREMRFYIDYAKMYDPHDGTWHDYSDDGAVPYLLNGRTMVPLYSIVRFLNGSLKWDEETFPGWTAMDFEILGHSVCVFLGWENFFVDGRVYSFNNVPELVDGHVRVELQPLLSAIGCEVRWNGTEEGANRSVTVTYEVQLRP